MINLIQKLESRKAELKKLSERQAKLRIEIDLLQQLLAEAGDVPSRTQNGLGGPHVTSATAKQAANGKRRRHKGHNISTGKNLAPMWQAVLKETVIVYPSSMDYDDIERVHLRDGYEPANRDRRRSHVWAMVQAGLYERSGYGTFRATQKAANVVGVPLGVSKDTKISAESETPDAETSGVSILN